MILAALCTAEDVRNRMSDLGLAVADTDESVITEAVERKITIGQEDLELALLGRIQKAIAPYHVDTAGNAPIVTITKLTTAAKTLLKTCTVMWVLYAIFDEGESRLRFKFDEAGDAIGRTMKRRDNERQAALEVVWPLLTFDLDGSGTVTTDELAFTNTLSSVRYSL